MTITVAATTITINSADTFEIVFDGGKGGCIDTWYDLEHDAGKAQNLTDGNSLLHMDLTVGGTSEKIYDDADIAPRLIYSNNTMAVVKTTSDFGDNSNLPTEIFYTVYANGLVVVDFLLTNSTGGTATVSISKVGLGLYDDPKVLENWLDDHGTFGEAVSGQPETPLRSKWIVCKLASTASILFADRYLRHRGGNWQAETTAGLRTFYSPDSWTIDNGDQVHMHFLMHLKFANESTQDMDVIKEEADLMANSFLNHDSDVNASDGQVIDDMAGDWVREPDDTSITTGYKFNRRSASYTFKAYNPNADVVESL